MLEGEGGGEESIVGIIYTPDYFWAKPDEPFRDMEDSNYLFYFATVTIWVLKAIFFLQALVNILPFGSRSVDPYAIVNFFL